MYSHSITFAAAIFLSFCLSLALSLSLSFRITANPAIPFVSTEGSALSCPMVGRVVEGYGTPMLRVWGRRGCSMQCLLATSPMARPSSRTFRSVRYCPMLQAVFSQAYDEKHTLLTLFLARVLLLIRLSDIESSFPAKQTSNCLPHLKLGHNSRSWCHPPRIWHGCASSTFRT